MEKFESSVKPIPYPVEDVYRNISDLNNLERVRDRVPADKLNSFAFDHDTVSVNVAPVGDLKLRIIEREENRCVKFETEQSPLPFNLWIQIIPDGSEAAKRLEQMGAAMVKMEDLSDLTALKQNNCSLFER